MGILMSSIKLLKRTNGVGLSKKSRAEFIRLSKQYNDIMLSNERCRECKMEEDYKKI